MPAHLINQREHFCVIHGPTIPRGQSGVDHINHVAVGKWGPHRGVQLGLVTAN